VFLLGNAKADARYAINSPPMARTETQQDPDIGLADGGPCLRSSTIRPVARQGNGTMRAYITATGMAFGLLVIWMGLVQF
jgi:hypothetical protein